MSEYTKPCTTCKVEIRMSNNSGKWLPSNLDGSPHRCYNNDNGQAKKEEMIPVPKALLMKMLEYIEAVDDVKHRLGAVLGVEK